MIEQQSLSSYLTEQGNCVTSALDTKLQQPLTSRREHVALRYLTYLLSPFSIGKISNFDAEDDDIYLATAYLDQPNCAAYIDAQDRLDEILTGLRDEGIYQPQEGSSPSMIEQAKEDYSNMQHNSITIQVYQSLIKQIWLYYGELKTFQNQDPNLSRETVKEKLQEYRETMITIMEVFDRIVR